MAVFNKIIIPLILVGYEMIIANSALFTMSFWREKFDSRRDLTETELSFCKNVVVAKTCYLNW